jgi:hypothetical protein
LQKGERQFLEITQIVSALIHRDLNGFCLIHFKNVGVPSQSQDVIRLKPICSLFQVVSILSKVTITKKQSLEKPKNLNLLNTVPFESGFHFYIKLGKYTGITACSIFEFAEKLQTVPIQSVTFHFQRQDFQKWLKNTVGDEELSKRIDQIKASSKNEDLRKELSKTVQNRIAQLQQHS